MHREGGLDYNGTSYKDQSWYINIIIKGKIWQYQIKIS